jgi:hypothetical protein
VLLISLKVFNILNTIAMLIYFISGIITGVSASSYLIGKELYGYYRKNTLQEKQLMRLRKLNHQLSTKNALTNNSTAKNVYESNEVHIQ